MLRSLLRVNVVASEKVANASEDGKKAAKYSLVCTSQAPVTVSVEQADGSRKATPVIDPSTKKPLMETKVSQIKSDIAITKPGLYWVEIIQDSFSSPDGKTIVWKKVERILEQSELADYQSSLA